MLTFTDSDDPLPLTEFTVMPDPPKETSAPGAKPVPLTTTSLVVP